jgi:hypothetical protein
MGLETMAGGMAILGTSQDVWLELDLEDTSTYIYI